MTQKRKKLIDISLSFALAAAICLSLTGFADSCEDMYDNIVRIRIIANSDSEDDQSLKLKVRDGILDYSKDVFSKADSYDEAVLIANENIDLLRQKAQSIIYDNGFDYSVSLRMGEEFFDTREYDGFTLPAGTYETLVFTIGEGNGENWWCVMFPQVCVGTCFGELSDTVRNDSAEYAENAPKYVLKFKAVEIFQKIKNFI